MRYEDIGNFMCCEGMETGGAFWRAGEMTLN